MIVIQTAIDHRAMTTLARVSRKTLRRGRSGPVRTLAWFVVALEAFLTVSYLRGGFGGWLPNTLMGLFMLGCLLLEDRINGAFLLRRIEPERRTVNVTFSDESTYVCRTQSGESRWLYSQIRLIAETEEYFVLLHSRSQGQAYSKSGLSWGTPEELRALLERKTGLKIQRVR
ncbi:YcxB family protein [Pseudoflavonifractor sp. 60]|uniref:YcxB family protein n=1 Tax=Pseudoflavonifractor sp. 60 TaxID=2304576 RepID=UPI00136B7529|nr:YcxB family protein [Pseudoflavonifractor sp. 60]NBI68723.1 YcxB family protein [Pseudoflavonifractor sp. 60]